MSSTDPGDRETGEAGCAVTEASPNGDLAAEMHAAMQVWLERSLEDHRAALDQHARQLQAQLLSDFTREWGEHPRLAEPAAPQPRGTAAPQLLRGKSARSGHAKQHAAKVVREEGAVAAGDEEGTAKRHACHTSEVSRHSTTSRQRVSVSSASEVPPTHIRMMMALRNWWESERTCWGRFESFVKSHFFEVAFVVIILANAMLMAAQLQLAGHEFGNALQIRGYDSLIDPSVKDSLELLDQMFTLCFVLELLARLVVFRVQWFLSLWNYVDALIVAFGVLSWAAPAHVSVDPTVMRLARFAKLMRLVRVLRSQNVLESLHLLMVCLRSCAQTLFWSVCVLILIQAIAGMLLSQLVETYITDPNGDILLQQQVFRYYGTFWRSMVTMFEITFANWAPACRLLLDNVGESFGLFFLVYRCVIGFAVLSVIQAVFINQTMKTAQQDMEFIMGQKAKEKAKLVAKLEAFFHNIDDSGDGLVSWEEFEPHLSDEKLKMLMSSLEIDVKDTAKIFQLLDGGDGLLTSEEFISGVLSVKGAAKALDLVTVLHLVRRLESRLDGELFARDDKAAWVDRVPSMGHKPSMGRKSPVGRALPVEDDGVVEEAPRALDMHQQLRALL